LDETPVSVLTNGFVNAKQNVALLPELLNTTLDKTI
jgi:hypothetical protein